MSSRNSLKAGGVQKQTNPDADLARSFGIGCIVVFIVFLCGWATIALFWLS